MADIFRYSLLLLLLLPSCKTVEPDSMEEQAVETVILSLADKNATAETKALYSNLWAIQGKAFLFGHQGDLAYGRYWYNETGRSDTKDVCGDYPAVYGMDFGEIIDDRATTEASQKTKEILLRCIGEAYDRGMVILGCMHLDNPLTGGDAWDNSSSQVVSEILKEGSETNIRYCSWLDRLADIANNLVGADGKTIPVIFRPYHEHTHEWSWWGSSCTTTGEFKELWQWTVRYLRDRKGVHNFIYAISPAMNSKNTEDDLLFRWPGDEWVDFMGMDCYHGINNSVFTSNLKLMSNLSVKKKKPSGVTETGVQGFTSATYWTENIHAPMTGRKISMIVTWSNKFVGINENDDHYFSVYKGHPSEKDFVKMYKEPNTMFCADLPDMYTMAEGIEVK